MANLSKHELLQTSSLIHRLDGRRKHPVGLIDVRRSQKVSPLLPPSIVQRFSLLERLHTRYGVKSYGDSGGSEMVVAPPSRSGLVLQPKPARREEGMPSESTLSHRSESPSLQAGGSTPVIHRSQAPGATFRIRRKVMPLERESMPITITQEPESSAASSDPTSDQATSPSMATSLQLKPPNDEQHRSSESVPAISGDSRVFRNAMESHLSLSDLPPLRSLVVQSMVMRSTAHENVEDERDSQEVLRAKTIPFSQRSAMSYNRIQAKGVATAREIQTTVPDVHHSPMIWRKHAQASHLVTNSRIGQVSSQPQIITRQPAAMSMSSSNQRSISSSLFSQQVAANQKPGISIGEVAEEVSRILCRQLTVQRERRGMRP